jgi:hypothetical protein
VFYVPVQQRPGAGFDDVGKVLKPLRPELLQAESPLAFRRSLARLIEAIRQPID